MLGGVWLLSRGTEDGMIRGIVWQVDNQTVNIAGSWDRLGAA
jgi:hypothetical protein